MALNVGDFEWSTSHAGGSSLGKKTPVILKWKMGGTHRLRDDLEKIMADKLILKKSFATKSRYN